MCPFPFLTGTAEKIVQVVVSRSHSVQEDQRLSFNRCEVHVTSQRLERCCMLSRTRWTTLSSFFHVNFNGTRRPQRCRTNEKFINGIKINFMIEMSPDKTSTSTSVAAEQPNKKRIEMTKSWFLFSLCVFSFEFWMFLLMLWLDLVFYRLANEKTIRISLKCSRIVLCARCKAWALSMRVSYVTCSSGQPANERATAESESVARLQNTSNVHKESKHLVQKCVGWCFWWRDRQTTPHRVCQMTDTLTDDEQQQQQRENVTFLVHIVARSARQSVCSLVVSFFFFFFFSFLVHFDSLSSVSFFRPQFVPHIYIGIYFTLFINGDECCALPPWYWAAAQCVCWVYRLDRMRENISQSWRTARPTELTHTHTDLNNNNNNQMKKNIIVQHLWLAPRARDVNRDNPTWNKFSVKLWGEPFRLQSGWSNERKIKRAIDLSGFFAFKQPTDDFRNSLLPGWTGVRGVKSLIDIRAIKNENLEKFVGKKAIN